MQVLLVDPTEGAQGGPQRCARPFTGVAVHFTLAIAIIIPCPLMDAMADRGMGWMTAAVAQFIGVCSCVKTHTPSDLVVDHWTLDIESNSPLDFLLRYALWMPFGRLTSYRIMSIISEAWDFTTKSGGI
jgi:hypothetical protein